MSIESRADFPLQVGQRVQLRIEDLAFGGEGVGRHQEFVVFVPFVIPGELVEVELMEVKPRFARGRLAQVMEASPDRVQPPCPYFGECGGCQYQHVRYENQLEVKWKQIADLFERVGGFSKELIAPVIPCPQEYGYRNRILVRTQWDNRKEGLNIGFLQAQSRLVVDIEECLIAEPALNQELKKVRANPPPKGGLKVMLRLPPEGWELPSHSFFQNNYHLLPKLLETVREGVQSSGSRHLVDVYCGIGFFGLELADLVESFAGIELDRPAIRAARRNAEKRGISNGEFISGHAEHLLPDLLKKFNRGESSALLDPPRTGCPPQVLETLGKERPLQILYISCHPATLARDLNVLCHEGVYELLKVTPLDMFPQTQHVECVADLRLSGGAGTS
jgi:tRNA/tmRNA/rRNA uracil-C5-methylase (TrmA/RlmC/RlmD family)